MSLKVLAILVPIVALGILAPVSAQPSDDVPGLETCEATTSKATVDLGGIYVAVDLTGVYLYEENGIREGLQRSDAGRDDTCRGKFRADDMLL